MKLPNLRHRGGTWYYDHGGKPRRWERLGTDQAVALARYKAIRARAKASPGTVSAMLADYLATAKGSQGTLANYKSYSKHLERVFGDTPAADLEQADILRYMELNPRVSFRGEVSLLSQAYKKWMLARLLPTNPCFGVRSGRPKSQRTRLITDGELDAIVAKADERLAVAIEFAYATGLRIADLCRLRWSEIADGVQTAKTGARLMFVGSEGFDALLARARALQSRVASMYVLCDRGGKPWRPMAIRRRWNTACKRAGVKDAHWHDLRAKGGTDTAKAGGIEAAQAFLGHKDAQTTRIYLRDKRANVVHTLTRRKA